MVFAVIVFAVMLMMVVKKVADKVAARMAMMIVEKAMTHIGDVCDHRGVCKARLR